GEKGILHFIFSLYGYDLERGMMIVDEPELHLHPQFQKTYLQILNQERKRHDLQFIVATHSPVFVDRDTIKSVCRFTLQNGRTQIIKPPKITESQRHLTHFLNYSNSSRIFFVKKIILVEGLSDQYFYAFYIDWLRDNDPALVGRIEDYEVLDVGGK